MSSSRTAALLTGVRIVLAGGGVLITALTVVRLAQMPPPTDGDGFTYGMATVVGSEIIVLSLGLATVSIIFPTMVGWDDPLGFSRRQRTALRTSGGLIGGGFIVGVIYGSLAVLPSGVYLWLLFIVVAAGIVCLTLLWRTVELLVGRFARGIQERS